MKKYVVTLTVELEADSIEQAQQEVYKLGVAHPDFGDYLPAEQVSLKPA